MYCPKYTTLVERVEKCKKLGICVKCTSIKHPIGSCPGNQNNLFRQCRFCQSRAHVASLCPKDNFVLGSQRTQQTLNNVCLITDIGDQSKFLLPVLTIQMQAYGGPRVSFNVLLDTGSSRSYIAPCIGKKLGLNLESVPNVQFQVQTFLGSGYKILGENTLEVHFPSGRHLSLPILIDNEFKVNMEVRGLNKAISNFKNLKVPLAAEYGDAYDSVVVNGLIGTDLLQYINFWTILF